MPRVSFPSDDGCVLPSYGTPPIYRAAEAKGVDIYFEAAVGGASPIVRPLRESLVGDKVVKLLAVVENGEAGVSARVYPALIDEDHPLASVHGSCHVVFVKAEAAVVLIL